MRSVSIVLVGVSARPLDSVHSLHIGSLVLLFLVVVVLKAVLHAVVGFLAVATVFLLLLDPLPLNL